MPQFHLVLLCFYTSQFLSRKGGTQLSHHPPRSIGSAEWEAGLVLHTALNSSLLQGGQRDQGEAAIHRVLVL